MDFIVKPTTCINVINNSSASSLGSSFGVALLSTCGGPINRLPNKIMQMIVHKLVLKGNVTNLMHIRSVSTKWRTTVEDYCLLKKSLMVCPKGLTYDYCSSYFERKFFGFVKAKDFVCIILERNMSSECLKSLVKLFPNTVQLSVSCQDHKVADLVEYINSLDSLKQLELEGSFFPVDLKQTLSKLEYFSFEFGTWFVPLKDYEIDECFGQIFSYLSPSCVRLRFASTTKVGHSTMLHWANTNAALLAGLTHLRFNITTSEEYAPIVHSLCQHATSLKHLNIFSLNQWLEWTPTVIGDFAKLTNLTHLELCHLKIKDIYELAQAKAQYRLPSLSSVLTCELSLGFDSLPIDVEQLLRVFAVIFPNLVEFNLTILDFYFTQDQFEQQLYRLPKLRKHTFEIDPD